jgi:hypothetical protein
LSDSTINDWDDNDIIENELEKEMLENATSQAKDGTNKNKGKYLEIPKDKKTLLNVLSKPQSFASNLFDYTCQGANWIYNDSYVRI